MNLTSTDVPLPIIIKNDAIDGFKSSVLDPELLDTFDRSGGIVIQYDDDDDQFAISLVGEIQSFRGPVVPKKPGIINLNPNSVFQIVQRCREQWESALTSVKFLDRKADGSEETRFPFEESLNDPVDQQTFDQVASMLAVAGNELFVSLFERDNGPELKAIAGRLRKWASSGEGALTISADKFSIPWRLLYTHPIDAGPLRPDGANFRTKGFWGYQHILEQFPEKYERPDFRLIAKEGVLAFGAALNEEIDDKLKVACVSSYREFVKAGGLRLSSAEWTDVKSVKYGLSKSPFPYQVIYFLCHAEGAGDQYEPNLVPWLEIAGSQMKPADVRIAVKDRFGGQGPLVFLNACRSGQYATLTSHNFSFASEFLNQGAKGFLGTQIQIPAVFAGSFGGIFFEKLMSAQESTKYVGHVLRDATRALWGRRNPLGLVYSLYGCADCYIVWDNKASA